MYCSREYNCSSRLITEVVNLHNLNNVNHVNNLENSNMKNLHVDCLDQLILVAHLPDVSVTNTNDCHYLL